MATSQPSPIHSAGPRPDNKPRIYNRPWHLDTDDRRHHGRRKWEPAALEAFLALASRIDQLYPPDFSARDIIRFRISGRRESIAELRTSNAMKLTLSLHRIKGLTLRDLRSTLQLPVKTAPSLRKLQIEFTHSSQVDSPAFAKFFHDYLARLQSA